MGGVFCIACIKEATRGPGKATFSIILMFSTRCGCLLSPLFKFEHSHARGWPGLELATGRLLPHLGLGFQSNPETHRVVGFLCSVEYYQAPLLIRPKFSCKLDYLMLHPT